MQPGDLWQHKLDNDKYILIVDYNSNTDEATVFKFGFSYLTFSATSKHINMFWKKIA